MLHCGKENDFGDPSRLFLSRVSLLYNTYCSLHWRAGIGAPIILCRFCTFIYVFIGDDDGVVVVVVVVLGVMGTRGGGI